MRRISTHNQNDGTIKQMKKSTSFSGISHNDDQDTSRIFYNSILKCPICQSKVRNAHMCPNCCKLFCQTCIKNWVIKQKQECPQCLQNLRLISIVNCEHLGKQIQDVLAKKQGISKPQTPQISSSMISNYADSFSTQLSRSHIYQGSSMLSSVKSDYLACPHKICQEHDLKLDYYCEQCKMGLCPDCAVLTDKHRGHKLLKLSAKQNNLKNQVQQAMKKINCVRSKIFKQKEIIFIQQGKIKNREQQKITYFFAYLKRFEELLVNLVHDSMQASDALLVQSRIIVTEDNRKLMDIQNSINVPNHVQLINQFDSLKDRIQLMNRNSRTIKNSLLNRNSEAIMVPQFVSFVFMISNFREQKNLYSTIFTQTFFWEGSQWRLRIEPKNKHSYLQETLSISLQMVKSEKQSARYSYIIDIVSDLDVFKKVSRSGQGQFKQGICKGHENFIKTSILYDQSIISSNDSMKIQLSIRLTSYDKAISFRNREIKQRYELFDRNIEKIGQLRKKAGSQELRLTSNPNISSVINESKAKGRGVQRQIPAGI